MVISGVTFAATRILTDVHLDIMKSAIQLVRGHGAVRRRVLHAGGASQ